MIKVLKTKLNPITQKDFKAWLTASLKQDLTKKLFKVNADFLIRALDLPSFERTLNAADLNIADGVGVAWAAKFLALPVSQNRFCRFWQIVGRLVYSLPSILFYPAWLKSPIPQTFPGIDCLKLILQIAVQKKQAVFFYGGQQANLDLAIKNLQKKYPKLNIVGALNGYDYSDQIVIKRINESRASIVFVALGSPQQEEWINKFSPYLNYAKILIGEGGTLDRIAHPKQQAPNLINKIGLESLWRLFFNPSLTKGRSRWKRFWNSVPRLIIETAKWKYRHV